MVLIYFICNSITNYSFQLFISLCRFKGNVHLIVSGGNTIGAKFVLQWSRIMQDLQIPQVTQAHNNRSALSKGTNALVTFYLVQFYISHNKSRNQIRKCNTTNLWFRLSSSARKMNTDNNHPQNQTAEKDTTITISSCSQILILNQTVRQYAITRKRKTVSSACDARRSKDQRVLAAGDVSCEADESLR